MFLSSPFWTVHTCSSVSFSTIRAPAAICLLWPSRRFQVSMALLSSRLTWVITSGHCQICIFRQLKHNLFYLNLSHFPPRLFLNPCRISQSMELVFHPVSQPDLIFFVTFSPSVCHIQSVLFFRFSLVIFLFNSPILPLAVAYFRLLTSLSQIVVVILTGLLVWGLAVIWAILYITWHFSV